MLTLVLITYNDWPLVKDCVESVAGYVDRIVAVDGAFRDFPGEGGSTDGTWEYLAGLEKCTAVMASGLSEVEKRNLYLVAENGYYLHLDADERVENPEQLLEIPDRDILFCPMTRDDGVLHHYPRVFRALEGLHYEGLHYRLVDRRGMLFADIHRAGKGYTSERWGLVLRHDREKRSEKRKRQKAEYYHALTEQEKLVKEMIEFGRYPS
jgi:hypothetical protein